MSSVRPSSPTMEEKAEDARSFIRYLGKPDTDELETGIKS